jgi:hypothetical protein
MDKWIIFFCSCLGGDDSVQHIIIQQDSVIALGYRWYIVDHPDSHVIAGMGDTVTKVKLKLTLVQGNNTVTMFIDIKWNTVLINIPELKKIEVFRQLPHKKKYYPPNYEL